MDDAPVSIRGLIEGGGTPLRRFKGKLADYNTEPATGYDGTRVNLMFGPDIEVLQSTEPYNLPTAVINLGLSNKKRSKWGYFSDSLAKFLPAEEDLKDCVGKVVGLVFTDGLDDRPSPEDTKIWNRDEGIKARSAQGLAGEELEALGVVYPDGMVPTPVFIVYELEGAAVAEGGAVESSADKLLKVLIGNTRAEFNKEALKLKPTPELQRAIIDKSFITGMVAAGKAHEDANGVFQAGPEPAAD